MTATYFSIKTQFENVGDALINREMIRLASQNSMVHLDLSRCDKNFSRLLLEDLPANAVVLKFGFFQLLLSIFWMRVKRVDCYYFLSPGGYFGEIRKFEILSKILSTLLLLVFSLSRIKVCHVGVSYERLGKAHTALLRFRSRILFRHLTRDQESFNLAQSLSIRVHGTIPDFAFNIFPDPEIKQSPAPAPAPALLLSFRTDQAKDQLNSAKALIDKLNDVYPENFLFNFYCQVERDRESTKTLHLHAKHNYKRQINFTDIQGDIEASLRFFKHNTHAISNRLHVLLMAASAGVKINAATYESFNQKTSNLLLEILNNADKKNSLIQLDGTNESLNTDNITFSITNQGSIEKQKLISDFSRIFRTQDTP